MKSRMLVFLSVMLIATLACGIDLESSKTQSNPPAQQPAVITVVVQPTTAPLLPTAAPETPTSATVSDPPTVTISGIGSYDCLPYPSFDFLFIRGIDDGKSVPVLAKAESQLSEAGVNWWQVKYEEGGTTVDCWVYGGTRYVVTSGDFSGVQVKKVIIPPPPKNHCDTAVKLAKAQIGVKVRLPYSQAPWMGRDGWFDGMAEYSGKVGRIIAIAGLDLSWCQTVYVEVYGFDTGYPWRVRDLDFSVKKGD